ncbi:hypothetical protein NEISUBOT_03835 [Neisseria subflava NJ9703]|uniref:Uncharacterized protein n=1 Tax=Neisseria subflava NJ9703 TaxID=546268 RepID=A0A9W5ISH5_NEISU|nr:hypothetical protein NEISUBOT_03835 [Neisseria subflava NJ9703]
MRHYFSQTYPYHNCEAIENTDKIKNASFKSRIFSSYPNPLITK